MVRTVLDGRKTQTRRVVKLPHQNPLGDWQPIAVGGEHGGRAKDGQTIPQQGAIWHTRTGDCLLSPYGAPGDRLWVRETCRAEELPGGLDGVRYEADNRFQPIDSTQEAADQWLKLNNYRHCATGKRGLIVPSIHMPRWASRILLEITEVRLERLQDCSESEAEAEGVDFLRHIPDVDETLTAKQLYECLWDRINGKRAWNANPWVWVVSFKWATA